MFILIQTVLQKNYVFFCAFFLLFFLFFFGRGGGETRAYIDHSQTDSN